MKGSIVYILTFIPLLIMMTACQPEISINPTKTNLKSTPISTSYNLPSPLPDVGVATLTPENQSKPRITPSIITAAPTSDTRLTPKYWREWPVVPVLSIRAVEILKKGIEKGNDAHSFIRIGDCQGIPEVFLGIYGTDRYVLPLNHKTLSDTITFFSVSFERSNVTAKDGFGVSSVLSTLFTNSDLCKSNETPLGCELRRNKPAIAFIVMGTNWQANSSAKFEEYLREIVSILLEHGTLPVIVTKADNIEGDWMLNLAMAKVAYDYDLPLINAWRAVQYLPNHGLEDNRIYMLPSAWDERNLAALLTLDIIREEIIQITKIE